MTHIEKTKYSDQYNPEKYFQATKNLLDGINPEPEAEHVYPLGGATEWLRMELQNKIEYGLFGAKHREHHLRLAASGFSPDSVAIIGVDPHGVMAKNIEEAYPNALKIAIDLNGEKIAQSKAEIDKNPNISHKFTWISGDATEILPQTDKVDLIDAQLVLIWGKDKAPLFYNPENGQFPTRKILVQSMSNALSDRGLLSVSDLVARDWHVQASPGFQSDPETQELVSKANTFISTLWKVGWDQTGGISWESDQQIANIVSSESQNTLINNSELSAIYELPEGGYQDPITAVYALMAPAANDLFVRTELQIKNALANNWANPETKNRLEQMLAQVQNFSPVFKNMAKNYVDIVQDHRVKTISAPIAAMVFQKSHV